MLSLIEAARMNRRGQPRGPPGNVGGAPGFEMFLEATADANHPVHECLLDWGDARFDPKDIEDEMVEMQFRHRANARIRKR